MNGTISELFGLLGAIVILAGVTVAVVNGGKTVRIINAASNGFVRSLRVATQQ